MSIPAKSVSPTKKIILHPKHKPKKNNLAPGRPHHPRPPKIPPPTHHHQTQHQALRPTHKTTLIQIQLLLP